MCFGVCLHPIPWRVRYLERNFRLKLCLSLYSFRRLLKYPMKAFQPVATRMVQSEDRATVAKPLRMLAVLLLLAACAAGPAGAQDEPRVQVFGGYSYTRFDSRSFGFSDSSGLNGYNFSPAFNLIRGFGVAAELSGQYGSKLNFRDLAVGPQFLYPRGKTLFFAHVLIGSARSFVRVGAGERDTERAVALGGGMDLNLTSRFAVRVFQVDYLHTTLFDEKQNNLRFSTGIVYHWGTLKRKGHRAPVQP